MSKIAIIGSGSWGVALAVHLSKKGHDIKIWSYSEEEADLINKQKRCKFLPNLIIPENIECFLDYESVVWGSDIVLHVTPSKVVRSTVQEYKKYITSQPVIMCSKGLEKGTLLSLSEVLKEEIPFAKIGVLSGPSHAEEVSVGVPTALVIASEHDDVIKMIIDLFMNENLRIYSSNDLKGVDVGGALKNIMAFCAGIAAGLGLGDNTFAALITRGLAEIQRLGVKMGGRIDTFYGLTGLGDLIVTCLSEHSRNRGAGFLIGKGNSLSYVQEKIGMTIESIDNIEIAKKLAEKYNVEMPIVDAVYDVLNNHLDPERAVNMLMTRSPKSE
ncbi:MAG: NAD(P)-dependent glycerol-3-phosphate dehydrogenase [Clostridia bacterium]|nr:NAD(P)-dependent glycerol-3-phosphate dehydrogenase [Clostridia bacterium]